MKFVYQYRTSDNALRAGEIYAASKDAAYALLKKQGVRPARLEEAPGFLNKVMGRGKRWIAIAALAVIALTSILLYHNSSEVVREIYAEQTSPLYRHQIYGDPARMSEWTRTGFANVLDNDGERFLAQFAQPGARVRGFDTMPVSPENVSEAVARSLADCLRRQIVFNDDDPREVVELKRVVLWMKGELSDYLSQGESIGSYVCELAKRQRKEAEILDFSRRSLENEKSLSVWDAKNEALRKLGLPTLLVPDDVE